MMLKGARAIKQRLTKRHNYCISHRRRSIPNPKTMRIGVPTSAHGRALPLPLALLAFLTFATTAASASFVPPMLTNPGKGAAKLKMSAGNLKSRATEYQLRQKEKAKLRTARENERRKHRWRGLTAGILLASQGFFACGAIVIALPSRAWRMLPGKMPAFWRVPHDALTTDAAGRLGFMLSNVAYLYAGIQLLLALPHAPHYGVLTLAVCGASCAYHAAQVLHGPESEASARTCSVDTALAIVTGLIFVSSVNIDAINLSLAAISLAFFTDRFSLGYTLSHSLWHLSTAACAVWSGGSLARQRIVERESRRSFGLPRQ